MQTKEEIIRIPTRLFKGDDLYLPLNNLGLEGSQVTLKIPRHFLQDQSILRLVYDEYHSVGFESFERSILMKLIPGDGVFLDIGAHFGLYSIFLAYHKPGLSCFAFEPAPDNFSVLQENCACNAKNQHIFCYPSAVGARSGAGFLRTNTSMGHHVVRSRKRGLDENLLEIEIFSLDDIFQEISRKYTNDKSIWMKVDVEGREMDVFSGGHMALKSGLVEGILWEYRVDTLENPERRGINRVLEELGYTSYRVSESNIISVRNDLAKNRSHFDILKDLQQE